MQAGERRQPGRAPRAVAATAELEGLRAAYLELLKLSLCDLAGPSTGVGLEAHRRHAAVARAGADELVMRAAGRRLAAARHDDGRPAAPRRPAGVRRGGRARRRRRRPDRGRHLARRRFDPRCGRRSTPSAPSARCGSPTPSRASRPPTMSARADRLPRGPGRRRARQLRPLRLRAGRAFVEGFFEDTLPGLARRRWSLVRLDGDTYEATWTTLERSIRGCRPAAT